MAFEQQQLLGWQHVSAQMAKPDTPELSLQWDQFPEFVPHMWHVHIHTYPFNNNK